MNKRNMMRGIMKKLIATAFWVVMCMLGCLTEYAVAFVRVEIPYCVRYARRIWTES